jgi:hypothetical protein
VARIVNRRVWLWRKLRRVNVKATGIPVGAPFGAIPSELTSADVCGNVTFVAASEMVALNATRF